MRASLRATAVLLAALTLGACGSRDDTAAPAAAPAATSPAPAAADPSPVATPPAAEPATAPSTDTTADAATITAASPDAATPAAGDPAPATSPAADPAAAAADTPKAAMPTGPAPREGTDYTLIEPAQPLTTTPGKVEIAEVFSYTCIHCARLDPLVPAWKATLPAGIEFVYVPMSNGSMEQIARGFHAAQALGAHDSTHVAMFKAVSEERRLRTGDAEEVAGLYGDLGVDEAQIAATMKSFGVNATIARTQKAIVRWQVEATPTLVVAGKYKVVVTQDRGHAGMLAAAKWLAERELAQAGTNAAP